MVGDFCNVCLIIMQHPITSHTLQVQQPVACPDADRCANVDCSTPPPNWDSICTVLPGTCDPGTGKCSYISNDGASCGSGASCLDGQCQGARAFTGAVAGIFMNKFHKVEETRRNVVPACTCCADPCAGVTCSTPPECYSPDGAICINGDCSYPALAVLRTPCSKGVCDGTGTCIPGEFMRNLEDCCKTT